MLIHQLYLALLITSQIFTSQISAQPAPNEATTSLPEFQTTLEQRSSPEVDVLNAAKGIASSLFEASRSVSSPDERASNEFKALPQSVTNALPAQAKDLLQLNRGVQLGTITSFQPSANSPKAETGVTTFGFQIPLPDFKPHQPLKENNQ